MTVFSRALRRIVSALAFVVVAALLATACGDLTPDSLAYTTDETEPTIIRIATPRIAGFEEVIASWEREHPTAEVEVVVRNIDDHHRSLLDDAGAGGQFDLIAYDASFGPEVRLQPELFIDLQTLDATPVPDVYLPSRWAEGVGSTGTLIGLPLDVESTALVVRTDLVGDTIIDQLTAASTWCDVLIAGDAFSDETNIAFLADGDDLLAAVLAQTRTSFVAEGGDFRSEELAELERAWDLAMIAVGEGPLHGNPCPDADGVQRITRNLVFDGSMWRANLRSDDFAAVMAPWSFRRRIANAAPETAGQWTTIALPVDATDRGSSSEGGLHLGIHATSPNVELAHDLLLTLANPIVQELAFANGAGPLPAASSLHTSGAVASATDDFFGSSNVGAVYSDAALGRPAELAQPQRRIVIEALVEALNRVESGGQTPTEAWTEALERIQNA